MKSYLCIQILCFKPLLVKIIQEVVGYYCGSMWTTINSAEAFYNNGFQRF